MKCFSSPSRIIEGLVIGSALLAFACSDAGAGSDPMGEPGGGSGGGGTAGTGGSGGVTNTAPACDDLSACASSDTAGGAVTTCVESVVAEIRDESGAAVPDFGVQVCGKDQCHREESDASGHVEFLLCRSIVEPALEIIGHSRFVTFASPLQGARTTFGSLTLIPLPSQGGELPDAAGALTTVSSGPVQLDIAAGTSLEVDALDCPSPDDRLLRAATVPLDKAPPGLDPAMDIELLVGLAPTCARLSAPAALTVPNEPGWSAGSKVDVLMHGIDPFGESPAPFGGWTTVASATVSGDGQQIVTDATPGNGITHFALLGFRLR